MMSSTLVRSGYRLSIPFHNPRRTTIWVKRRQSHACKPRYAISISASSNVVAPLGLPAPPGPLVHDGWALWCLLAACGGVAQLLENHTRWGAALSAPLVSMLCAVALAAGGVIPVDCGAYDTVWRYLMPLAAACFLLETDVQRLISDGGPLLAAFTVGAVGMVLGAVAGWAVLREPLGPLGTQLAACLCASYVGGSVNFAAVAQALQLPAAAVPGAMAADNLMMAVFLGVLMAVPTQRALTAAAAAAATATATATAGMPLTDAAEAAGEGAGAVASCATPCTACSTTDSTASSRQAAAQPPSPSPPVTAESVSLTLAAAAAACTASQHLAAALNAVPMTLLIMAAVAATISAAAQWLRSLAGGESSGTVFVGAAQLGTSLMMVFFAVIGASAGSFSCLASCAVLVPFLSVMVAVHWLVMELVGRRLLRLPLEVLLLGSNANIGGPATAAAMATAKGWRSLVQPAMLTGSLGYAAGTAAGLAVARLVGAAVR